MRDIQKYRIITTFFEFSVNGAGHNVTASQILLGIILVHEGVAGGVYENTPFTSDGFRNQKVFSICVIQSGGMKLDEFKVGYRCTGAIGHGYAVTGSDIRVAGV